MPQTTSCIISPYSTDVNRHSPSRCSRAFAQMTFVLLGLFFCGCGLGEYEKRLDVTTREYRRIAAEVAAKERVEAAKREKEQGGPRRPRLPPRPGAPLRPPVVEQPAPAQPVEQPPAAEPAQSEPAAPEPAAPVQDAAAEGAPAPEPAMP